MSSSVKYITKESSRAKNVSITVDIDGTVSVTKPFWMPQFVADAYVEKKKGWILRSTNHFKSLNYPADFDFSRVRRLTRRDYLKHKESARLLIHQRLQHFNQIYKFPIKRIAIRNQKSCWGSCSETGNLNFNYRLLFLPEELRDYVIVHELCHLEELNHSPRFWALVARTVPDYKILRKNLKKEELLYQ